MKCMGGMGWDGGVVRREIGGACSLGVSSTQRSDYFDAIVQLCACMAADVWMDAIPPYVQNRLGRQLWSGALVVSMGPDSQV
jgi:hypothetical protein